MQDINQKAMVGDLIFIQSQSSQSSAVQAAQFNSPWTHVGIIISAQDKFYVAEASKTVSVSPLESLISRSKNQIVVIKRLKSKELYKQAVQLKLVQNISEFKNRKYDYLFEWSDTQIYCSELVYKSFLLALNISVGDLVTVRDLNYTAPIVDALIKERYEAAGRKVDWDTLLKEKIVTPASQFEDNKFYTVYDNQEGH